MYIMSINIQNICIHNLFSNITSGNFLEMTMFMLQISHAFLKTVRLPGNLYHGSKHIL